jgi:hypothetical protein
MIAPVAFLNAAAVFMSSVYSFSVYLADLVIADCANVRRRGDGRTRACAGYGSPPLVGDGRASE